MILPKESATFSSCRFIFFWTLSYPELAFIGSIISSANNEKAPEPANPSILNLLQDILPDSVFFMIKDKPAIFFSCGHYGFSWALLTKADNCYQAYNGKVNYSGDKDLTKSISFSQSDSTAFFSTNKTLLTWGFDTLSTESLKLKPIKREPYITIYENLSIITSNGECIFRSDDVIGFSGPDSLNFNNKFHKLCLLMRWLSMPEIRQYIPESAIFNY